jgi:hypothetical protein
MSEIAQSVDEIIKLGLADLLKTNGYKKSGRNWHKPVQDNWLIVNVQASSGNTGSEGKFAINLGVYHAEIAALAGQSTIDGKPKEYDSTVRERLGMLAYGRDHWWAINSVSNLKEIAAEVVEKMSSFGIPWLNSHTEASQISAALENTPSLHAVCAALASGNKSVAEQRLIAAIQSRPAAKAHFHSWATKNGFAL